MRSTILCRETKEIKEFAAAGSRSFLPSIRRIPCLKIPAGAVRKSRDETTSSTLLPRRRHRWLTTMSLAACRLTLNGDGAAERRYELAPLPGSAGNWTTVVRGRNFLIARRWSPSCESLIILLTVTMIRHAECAIVRQIEWFIHYAPTH